MIGILIGIGAFLISPFGLLSILAGFVGFALLPVLGMTTSLRAPVDLLLYLARKPINRAAIVVGEHGDLYFKTMSFDSLGVEVINLDGEKKVFEDPDSALHYWMGIPFAFADEVHGVLFDPRHAALGQRKHLIEEHGEGEYHTTDEEWQEYGVSKWKPGVFEMPNVSELVNLSRVREIVDGGERSEYAKRVEEIYKHSRAPFDDGTPATHFLYPIIGFLLVFGGIWVMSSQLDGGGAPDTSIGFGSSFFALIAVPAIAEYKRQIATIVTITAVAAPIVAIAIFVSPLIAVACFLGVCLGFFALPMLTLLLQPLGNLGAVLSKMYFKLAFMSFDQPVLKWTPRSYRLVEYDDIDDGSDVKWYTLFGAMFGVTYEPGEDSWGAETVRRDEIEARQVATDGGSAANSNLPPKFVPSDLSRDKYGAYLPKRLSHGKYYIDSGIALARFKNSAVGEKSLKQLLEAKEKHGESGNGVSDKTVLYMTAAAGLLGLILGVFFFVL